MKNFQSRHQCVLLLGLITFCVIYFIYFKIIKVELLKRYYLNQGMKILMENQFGLGHKNRILKVIADKTVQSFSLLKMSHEDFFEANNRYEYPDSYMFQIGTSLSIIISHHELVSDLFLTKNKYFDKHPFTGEFLKPLLGDSMFFARSGLKQSQQRKSLSSSFYKEKLVKYLQIINECTDQSIEHMKACHVDTENSMDLIDEVQKIFIKIILKCVFDEDQLDEKLDYVEDGKILKMTLGQCLLYNMTKLLFRMGSVKSLFFPEYAQLYLFKGEKEHRQNARMIRGIFNDIVQRRRNEMKQPGYKNKEDLLSTLMEDELFANDNDVIIDQCMTFFLAGSQTLFFTTSNLMMFVNQNPDMVSKLRIEYEEKVLQDRENSLYDKIQNLNYYSNCFYESLRIEPPVYITSGITLTEDCKIGPYNIKQGTQMFIDLGNMQKNPEQWRESEKFIPERFDPSSSYFLTPNGNKRHPYSYAPFLGGTRICVGKTFAELASKVVGPKLLHAFDYEFVNKDHYKHKPMNNLATKFVSTCHVKITSRPSSEEKLLH